MLTSDRDNPSANGPKLPALDVVIVNWNSGRQLSACLGSFGATAQRHFRLAHVVVVDNGSTDGSLDGLPTVPANTSIVRNTANRGFAAACNQGAALCDGDYLLLLNPDTVLMEESLDHALAYLENPEHLRVGVLGIQLIDEDGQIARSCARAPRPTTFFAKMLGLDRIAPRWFPPLVAEDWDHRDSRPVAHVIGAFYLVRRSLWVALSGFDERFFVYLEDLDFSIRVHAAGWQIVYLASAQAFHRGGGSSAGVKPARLCLSLHSRIRYGYKHFNWWPASLLLVGTLFLEPLIRIVRSVASGDLQTVSDTFVGYWLLWRWLLLGIRPGLAREPRSSMAGTRPAHG